MNGQIVILNGAPRSGKSSIVRAMQADPVEPWMNLGVDIHVGSVTPPALRPGIGLRPGGERPDLETLVPRLYLALYDSIAAHSRLGLNVVADVGHHDCYQRPLNILPRCARRLEGLPVMFVGVKCSIEAIMERRNAGEPGREGVYVRGTVEGLVPEPVKAWQREVHSPGIYDLEVDTSEQSPETCAALILARLREGGGAEAFERLAHSLSDSG